MLKLWRQNARCERLATGLNEVGLEVADVIVSFNGASLESARGDPQDPDDRFVELLRELPCGSDVTPEYVRGGQQLTARFIWGH